MRISDWSSGVCSSDLWRAGLSGTGLSGGRARAGTVCADLQRADCGGWGIAGAGCSGDGECECWADGCARGSGAEFAARSEEHTSELQSLMRISYAVFCLKKKKNNTVQSLTHNN